MRLKLTSLLLTGLLLAGLWPLGGLAQAQVTPPGFSPLTKVSGLTTPGGFVTSPRLDNFPCCDFIVEQSLNRVSRFDGGPLVPFASGLATPTDLVSPGELGTSPFGNFLYAAESGANRISRINEVGGVTPFAVLPAAPRRMAFSGDPGAFGTFLFTTLANGQLVKVDPLGTVSPCASGLSGPEGLVFAPGGGAFKTALFVAEMTANRISKVDSACMATPFASTGLSNPVGLAISPGGGWGLPNTLYVGNAGTRVDRVDSNGMVTPFASGFGQVDALHLKAFGGISDRLGADVLLRVSDGTAGTLTAVFIEGPFISPQLAGCNPCRPGDAFALNLIVANPAPLALSVEVKSGVQFPDGTTINFSPLANKHFEVVLPPALPRTTFPWLALPWPGGFTGRFCYLAGLGDPEVFGGGTLSNGTCFDALP